MTDDIFGACTETTACAQWARQVANDHVNLRGVYILSFGDAAAGPAEDAKRPRFVEDHAELVLLLQLDLQKKGSVIDY